MNDDARIERLFEDGLHGIAPSRAPDRLKTTIKNETGQMRPLPRWLALIKEPPMRISSNLAVGSPTARIAATTVATLLLALDANRSLRLRVDGCDRASPDREAEGGDAAEVGEPTALC